MSADSVRVAIIGVGFGAAVIAPAMRRDERVRLVGVCATTQEGASAAARRLGISRAWDDWRAVVCAPDVDAVAIAVPPALQPEIIRTAALHRKHVFCEKPVGLDQQATAGLLEAVAAAGIVHAVDFEMAELPSWRRARDARNESTTWGHFALSWRVETRANTLGGHPWKASTELGGGALLSFVPHVVHGIEWMIGRIERVTARLTMVDASAETRVDAWVELEGGITGTISVATDALHGSGMRLEIYGSDRTMFLENRTTDHMRNYVLTMRKRSDAEPSTLVDERSESVPSTDGRIEPVAALARRFIDAALGGPPVRPGLEEGLRVTSVLDAMRASHERNAWQATP